MFLHVAFSGTICSSWRASWAVTGSRCSHCWSALEKGFAQTYGSRPLPASLLPPYVGISLPQLFGSLSIDFRLRYCSVRNLCLPLPWRSRHKGESGRHEMHGDTSVASWLFPPSHYSPTQWDCGGRSEWHFQTENLKLHFNTQPLSCHRNNTRQFIWFLTNSHLSRWEIKAPPQSNIDTHPIHPTSKKCHGTSLKTTPKT